MKFQGRYLQEICPKPNMSDFLHEHFYNVLSALKILTHLILITSVQVGIIATIIITIIFTFTNMETKAKIIVLGLTASKWQRFIQTLADVALKQHTMLPLLAECQFFSK